MDSIVNCQCRSEAEIQPLTSGIAAGVNSEFFVISNRLSVIGLRSLLMNFISDQSGIRAIKQGVQNLVFQFAKSVDENSPVYMGLEQWGWSTNTKHRILNTEY